MTAKQKQVLDQIHDLMLEHFDAGVYIVTVNASDDEPNSVVTDTSGGYTGGIPFALGLMDAHAQKLRYRFVHGSDPRDEEPPTEDDWRKA